ncbi:MAG: translation initiation factor [Victivallales bacterium]|nr:translation initiation factor [Victivallales bacterium]
MKKRNQNNGAAREEIDRSTWNNPFMDLKLDLPATNDPPPPPPPPKTPQQLKQEKMSKDDLALLKAFGGDELSVGSAADSTGGPLCRGRLSFNIQRKGKGGKTVTKVFGLQDLELTEQMELCSAVKNALGCGARFADSVLEIQGDQRDRAMKWFSGNGYKV